MRYHIDTIPVWDALKLGTECPLCALRRKVELTGVERCLGGSVMEPDTRIRVNEKGFCPRHHALLYAQQNRLGHALMTHTHLIETEKRALPLVKKASDAAQAGADAPLLKRVSGKTGVKEALLAAADKLESVTATCVLCDEIDDNMRRYTYTLLHLYNTDEAFRTAFKASRGVCLIDLPPLLRMAADTLKGDMLRDFCADLERLTRENLARVEKELEWFTLKFDYRNADKPWGESRDALERAAMKLRGWCVGAELNPK